jgi:hypothetical protein
MYPFLLESSQLDTSMKQFVIDLCRIALGLNPTEEGIGLCNVCMEDMLIQARHALQFLNSTIHFKENTHAMYIPSFS